MIRVVSDSTWSGSQMMTKSSPPTWPVNGCAPITSAPAVSPTTLSTERLFAVSMMTGKLAVTGSDRSRRHSSTPSMYGIITSSNARSGSVSAMMPSASWPSCATRTSKPSSRRLTSMNLAMSTSSSTTSTVLIGPSRRVRRSRSGPPGRAGHLLGPGPKPAHGVARVLGAVDRGPGHEDVGPRLRAPTDRVLVDAAVDLHPDRVASVAHELPCPPHLREDHVEEPLAAEPGLDRHHQHHVELGQEVGVGLDRCRRLERKAGAGTRGADRPRQPDRRVRRLDVEGDVARPGP